MELVVRVSDQAEGVDGGFCEGSSESQGGIFDEHGCPRDLLFTGPAGTGQRALEGIIKYYKLL